jgi:CHAT domain-containing protein
LEILGLRTPANLVVLSACETGKGTLVRGEGTMGLARAFLFAGAPRVICSLWKVDDEATRALMVRFYELWNPKEGKGMGAAEALREARTFVREHRDAEGRRHWEHPFFWAAWTLWGVPD